MEIDACIWDQWYGRSNGIIVIWVTMPGYRILVVLFFVNRLVESGAPG
jgi:hypothetical protein